MKMVGAMGQLNFTLDSSVNIMEHRHIKDKYSDWSKTRWRCGCGFITSDKEEFYLHIGVQESNDVGAVETGYCDYCKCERIKKVIIKCPNCGH